MFVYIIFRDRGICEYRQKLKYDNNKNNNDYMNSHNDNYEKFEKKENYNMFVPFIFILCENMIKYKHVRYIHFF